MTSASGSYANSWLVPDNSNTRGQYTLEINSVFGKQRDNKLVSFYVLPIAKGSFNNPPVADAGTGGHFPSGALITLDGSKSNDQDDSKLFYTWTQIKGLDVLMNKTIAKPTFTIPDIAGMFEFNLAVSDGRKSGNNSSNVAISSIHANAGENETYTDGTANFTLNSAEIILDGSKSKDSLNHSLDYVWEIFGNVPIQSTLTDSKITNPTQSVSKFTPDVIGKYNFTLAISDNYKIKDSDNIMTAIK